MKSRSLGPDISNFSPSSSLPIYSTEQWQISVSNHNIKIMGEVTNQKQHFVLIHGSVAGAWIWYKVKPRLEEAGHRVTALDMAASGVNTKTIEEVRTFDLYNEPLMEFMAKLPENEKVVLVGHSLGGLNLAFAMEKFPEKVSLAVFLTAILPDTVHQPSYMLEKVPLCYYYYYY